MTDDELHDRFAMAALAGLIARGDCSASDCCLTAFQVADDAMAQRTEIQNAKRERHCREIYALDAVVEIEIDGMWHSGVVTQIDTMVECNVFAAHVTASDGQVVNVLLPRDHRLRISPPLLRKGP